MHYPEKDTVLTTIKIILLSGNLNKNLGATLLWRPFFLTNNMTDKDNEELRPTKMRGVAFPKAKYGVILAVIVIIVVNLIYYKETILSFFK